MGVDALIAFRHHDLESQGLEILVNFGIFAGREATPAEIDELARLLLPEVDDLSIVSEQRHEIGNGVEASLHLVRVEIANEQLPADEGDAELLADRLVEAAERWAEACIAERHAEVTEL
jgi:hypothetical protein